MGRLIVGFVMGLLAAAIAAVLVLLIGDLKVEPKTPGGVVVPYLVGKGPRIARAKVEALGLTARIVYQCERGILGNCARFIGEETPKGGTRIDSDGTVTLFVEGG
jgi:hypothetical protein